MNGAVMNDTVLSQNVVKCLIKNFGVIDTERFISLVIKEPFDYTEWQRDLFADMTVDELFTAASEWKKSKTKKAN
jgi:hypothetical protein